MSCTGCMYLVGKEAICPMTYACSGKKPDLFSIAKAPKPKRGKKDSGESVNG